MKRQTIVAGASIMMVAALLSRILGWVRDRAIGHFWGTSVHADAYWAAFMVPDLLYYLLAGGAIGAAVVPVFSSYVRREDEPESWRAANTLVTLFGLLALSGVVLIVVFAPFLVRLVVPGFGKQLGEESFAECAGYVRIIAPMVLFTVMSAFSTGILQAHRHFTAPAFAWIVYNFGIIAGAFAGGLWAKERWGDVAGLKVLCAGVLVGAALLVAVQIPGLMARGCRYRPALELHHPGVREVVRLFVPYMAGLAFTQVCLLVLPTFFGSYFEGGVSSLRFANRLIVLPLGLFGVAISTAAFPSLAARIDAGEFGEFRRTFSATLRAVFALSVPSAAALVVLAGPILRLLWRSGEFSETAVQACTFILLFYPASLIGLSGLQIVNRAFYSLKDRVTPPAVGIGYTVVIVVLAIALMRTRLQYASIAAASSVGFTLGLLVLFELLRRRLGGVDGRAIALSFLRVVVASAALAAASFAVSRWVGGLLGVPWSRFPLAAPDLTGAASGGPQGSFGQVALQVLASLVAGGVSYLVVLRLLGASEFAEVRELVRRRRRPSGRRSSAE